MFPVCLTEENFPLLVRARDLCDQALRSAPGQRRATTPDYLDVLVVPALTNCAVRFLENSNLGHAEEVLLVAVRIQKWLNHPTHADLLDPLIALGQVYALQNRLSEAEETLLRSLTIAAKTDARIEQHETALVRLIAIYSGQNRRQHESEMRAALERLRGENPYMVKDRPNDRSE